MTDSKMAQYTENEFVAGPLYRTLPELPTLPRSIFEGNVSWQNEMMRK